MTNHVPTIETSQRLKEAGLPQNTYFSWHYDSKTNTWNLEPTPHGIASAYLDWFVAAPILTEILELLEELLVHPEFIRQSDGLWGLFAYPDGVEKFIKAVNPPEAAAFLWLELTEEHDH